MSLFIKGMELPKSGEKIIILTSSGYIEDVSGQVIEGAEAVSIPTPHGRLIDEKCIKEYITDTTKGFEEMNRNDLQNYSLIAGLRTVEVMIEHAPTIIEAEE